MNNFKTYKRLSLKRGLLKILIAVCTMLITELRAEETIKILPLGDSITQGGNARPSYRRALWLQLKESGFNVDFVGSLSEFHNQSPPESQLNFDLHHEGHWGWETNQIAEELPNWLNFYTPDIALVHLGTNDFDRGEAVSKTLEDLNSVLNSLRQDNPEITILLAEIIPMRFKSTRKFNAELRNWARTQSTPHSKLIMVDLYSGYYSLYHSYDKYHPNARGEEKIARGWFNALSKVLKSN